MLGLTLHSPTIFKVCSPELLPVKAEQPFLQKGVFLFAFVRLRNTKIKWLVQPMYTLVVIVFLPNALD